MLFLNKASTESRNKEILLGSNGRGVRGAWGQRDRYACATLVRNAVKIVRTWVESFPSFSRRSSEILVGEAAGPVAKRVPVAGRACTGTDLETAVAMGARAETNALEAVRMASWRASRCATPLPDLIIFSRRTGLFTRRTKGKLPPTFSAGCLGLLKVGSLLCCHSALGSGSWTLVQELGYGRMRETPPIC